jgi:hypothetical protein
MPGIGQIPILSSDVCHRASSDPIYFELLNRALAPYLCDISHSSFREIKFMANNAQESGRNRNGLLRENWKETVLTCGTCIFNRPRITPKVNCATDGGGIRGYASLLMLRKLMERVSEEEQRADALLRQSRNLTSSYVPEDDPLRSSPPLPCHYFDYIVGTSTGG